MKLSMKRELSLTLITALLLTLNGCATKSEESREENAFRNSIDMVSDQEDNHRRADEQEVVCTNCQATFKVSRKLAMKPNAVIVCPICHHNYKRRKI